MRLGIFGGTFDPPHLGHINLAEEALNQFQLNHVLWVLTPEPPHKNQLLISEINNRIEMVNAAIKNNKRFSLSRVDIERYPPHYAVETLSILKKEYPEDELYYLIGGDSLVNLPHWYNPLGVVANCHKLGVFRRLEQSIDTEELNSIIPGITNKINFIDSRMMNISATNIRKRIFNGEPYEHLLPITVCEIISKRNLYKAEQNK